MNDIFGHQLVKVVKMKSTVLAHDTFLQAPVGVQMWSYCVFFGI